MEEDQASVCSADTEINAQLCWLEQFISKDALSQHEVAQVLNVALNILNWVNDLIAREEHDEIEDPIKILEILESMLLKIGRTGSHSYPKILFLIAYSKASCYQSNWIISSSFQCIQQSLPYLLQAIDQREASQEPPQRQIDVLKMRLLQVKVQLQSAAITSHEKQNKTALEFALKAKFELKALTRRVYELSQIPSIAGNPQFRPFFEGSAFYNLKKFLKEIEEKDPTSEDCSPWDENQAPDLHEYQQQQKSKKQQQQQNIQSTFWKHNTENNHKYIEIEISKRLGGIDESAKLDVASLRHFNIGDIMHVNNINHTSIDQELCNPAQVLTDEYVSTLVLYYACCLFTIATEKRFVVSSRLEERMKQMRQSRLSQAHEGQPLGAGVSTLSPEEGAAINAVLSMHEDPDFKLSEVYLFKAIEVVKVFVKESAMLDHFISSYQKNYNCQLHAIPEEDEFRITESFLSQVSQPAEEYQSGMHNRPTHKDRGRSNSKEFVERLKMKYNQDNRPKRKQEIRLSGYTDSESFSAEKMRGRHLYSLSQNNSEKKQKKVVNDGILRQLADKFEDFGGECELLEAQQYNSALESQKGDRVVRRDPKIQIRKQFYLEESDKELQQQDQQQQQKKSEDNFGTLEQRQYSIDDDIDIDGAINISNVNLDPFLNSRPTPPIKGNSNLQNNFVEQREGEGQKESVRGTDDQEGDELLTLEGLRRKRDALRAGQEQQEGLVVVSKEEERKAKIFQRHQNYIEEKIGNKQESFRPVNGDGSYPGRQQKPKITQNDRNPQYQEKIDKLQMKNQYFDLVNPEEEEVQVVDRRGRLHGVDIDEEQSDTKTLDLELSREIQESIKKENRARMLEAIQYSSSKKNRYLNEPISPPDQKENELSPLHNRSPSPDTAYLHHQQELLSQKINRNDNKPKVSMPAAITPNQHDPSPLQEDVMWIRKGSSHAISRKLDLSHSMDSDSANQVNIGTIESVENEGYESARNRNGLKYQKYAYKQQYQSSSSSQNQQQQQQQQSQENPLEATLLKLKKKMHLKKKDHHQHYQKEIRDPLELKKKKFIEGKRIASQKQKKEGTPNSEGQESMMKKLSDRFLKNNKTKTKNQRSRSPLQAQESSRQALKRQYNEGVSSGMLSGFITSEFDFVGSNAASNKKLRQQYERNDISVTDLLKKGRGSMSGGLLASNPSSGSSKHTPISKKYLKANGPPQKEGQRLFEAKMTFSKKTKPAYLKMLKDPKFSKRAVSRKREGGRSASKKKTSKSRKRKASGAGPTSKSRKRSPTNSSGTSKTAQRNGKIRKNLKKARNLLNNSRQNMGRGGRNSKSPISMLGKLDRMVYSSNKPLSERGMKSPLTKKRTPRANDALFLDLSKLNKKVAGIASRKKLHHFKKVDLRTDRHENTMTSPLRNIVFKTQRSYSSKERIGSPINQNNTSLRRRALEMLTHTRKSPLLDKSSSSRYNQLLNNSSCNNQSTSMSNSLHNSDLSFLKRYKKRDNTSQLTKAKPLNSLIKNIYQNAASNAQNKKRKYPSTERLLQKGKYSRNSKTGSVKRQMRLMAAADEVNGSSQSRINMKNLQRNLKKPPKKKSSPSNLLYNQRKASMSSPLSKQNLQENIRRLLESKDNQTRSGGLHSNSRTRKAAKQKAADQLNVFRQRLSKSPNLSTRKYSTTILNRRAGGSPPLTRDNGGLFSSRNRGRPNEGVSSHLFSGYRQENQFGQYNSYYLASQDSDILLSLGAFFSSMTKQ